MAVRVTAPDRTERTYERATAVTRDGNGDFELRDANGEIVAFRRRGSVEDFEVVGG
jgi:hypothetical protein